ITVLGEGKKELDFLIDTGATFSVLNQELVPKSDEFVQVVGATGQPEKAYFLKPIKYKIGKQMGIHQFLYLPNSPKPLLGRDLLENLGAIIKFNKDKLEFQVNEEQLITALSLTISCVEPKPENHNIERILSEAYPLVWHPLLSDLKLGQGQVVRKQYPLRIEDREGIEPIIKRFLELGLLVECESDFNTPILPVRKPNGAYRLVQDLRAVNEITKTLHPVVANPYTLLTKLKDNLAWFNVLDLKDAFFCLPLAPESQKIFAFEWEFVDRGRKTQLTWTVLPQGWCNSPTIFGNQLAKELEQWERPLGDGTLLQYVDDLLIATVTEEECNEWTISLLNFLGLSGYRVSQQKAQLVQTEVVYLGYEISRGQTIRRCGQLVHGWKQLREAGSKNGWLCNYHRRKGN
uniref:ribonuclease H n=1 Tax=Geospiza parvula TaxID=87175 RepID=A0A8U8C2L6_GEOPR